MAELIYRFTRSQLHRLLSDAITMYREECTRGHAEPRATAIAEMFDGLDADRELVATDGHERLRLQLPTPHHLLTEADASAAPYEANTKALS